MIIKKFYNFLRIIILLFGIKNKYRFWAMIVIELLDIFFDKYYNIDLYNSIYLEYLV